MFKQLLRYPWRTFGVDEFNILKRTLHLCQFWFGQAARPTCYFHVKFRSLLTSYHLLSTLFNHSIPFDIFNPNITPNDVENKLCKPSTSPKDQAEKRIFKKFADFVCFEGSTCEKSIRLLSSPSKLLQQYSDTEPVDLLDNMNTPLSHTNMSY